MSRTIHGSQCSPSSPPRYSVLLRGHEGRLTAATFAPAGARVYTAGIDGTVRTYDCGECRSGTALVAVAVAVARAPLRATGRTLTAAERSRFVR